MKVKLLTTFLLASITLTACSSSSNNSVKPTTMPEPTLTAAQLCEKQLEAQTSEDNTTVVLKTNKGDVTIELFNSTMPITAGNFQKLVEEGFYDGVIFHRVIPNFMAQGGDPDGLGTGGPGYTIEDEFTDYNCNGRGTISMANAGPNTGGSQFFINVVDNNFLDLKHPVFGIVTEGMDVVDEIVSVKTEPGDRPVKDIVIEKAKVVKKDS